MSRSKQRVRIEDARNLGPVSASEMSTIGIHFLDQIEEMGWEEFCAQYAEAFPHRLNLNAFTAVIGAIEDQDWRKVDQSLKVQAKRLIGRLKSGS